MKLSRGLILVGALAVGSAGLVGCNAMNDDGAQEAASVGATDEGAQSANDADQGTEQDARFGRGGRGFRGARGFRRGGWGRGWGHHLRRFWHFW